MTIARNKVKMFVRELLKVWEINLGEMYLLTIDGKIDKLSDGKVEESVKLIKGFF
ncbi:MAG: hypothetical protein AABX93_02175 [Nanoarchaeota archaeon]